MEKTGKISILKIGVFVFIGIGIILTVYLLNSNTLRSYKPKAQTSKTESGIDIRKGFSMTEYDPNDQTHSPQVTCDDAGICRSNNEKVQILFNLEKLKEAYQQNP